MLIKYNFNRIWNAIKRTALRPLVQQERDLPLAMDLLYGAARLGRASQMGLSRLLLGSGFTLQGAYGNESARWLYPDITGVMDFTGTGSEGQLNILGKDRFVVTLVGATFSVAGTTTPVKIDFDLYPAPDAKGTITSSNLDGTNGTITAPNATTSMAIGASVYKDLNATGPVRCAPGSSIDCDVATACTAGNGLAWAVGVPIAEEPTNLSTFFASA